MYKLPTVKQLLENTENGNHRFTVVSTFAGGGGSSTGYRMAGGKVLLVNEFVEEARKTYSANWRTTKVLPDVVRKITGKQILDEIGLKPLELDIFDGSPPCSAFSTEGLCFTDADRVETDISKYASYKLLKTVKPGGAHEKRFNLLKGSKNSVSGCMTAIAGNLSAAAPRHWDNRAYTVAETKRIMSIPDDYILTGDYSKQVERLGRMVPPLMMKGVAENLYKLVLSK